jgi:hypothetical protein
MVHSSVPDNARDAVLLHVSASSERQESENEIGAMKKQSEHQLFEQSKNCMPTPRFVAVNGVSVV